MSNSNPWTAHTAVTTSDGLTLAVRTGGRPDGPTVVFVHGYPDSSQVWDDVAGLLAGTIRVVAYDVRGAGGSDLPAERSGYLLDQLARDLLAVVDAVSPTEPVHLVGHDWGSVQCWEAITEPRAESRFSSFTSMSGPCLDHLALTTRRLVTERPAAAVMQAARSWYVGFFHLPKLPEFALARGAARRLAPDSTGSPADAVNGLGIYRANVRRVMRRPRDRSTLVPVQVLVATADPFVGRDVVTGLEAWVSDLAVVEVDGGHWLPRTHPECVASYVLSFTSAHPAAPSTSA